MAEMYLTGPQVTQRYQISNMTLYRWQHDENLNFPKPMTVNRRKYFKESDLADWDRSQTAH